VHAPVDDVAAPGSWLGLLGGGQLGRMFCMAAQSLGYRVAVLDPDADGPAAALADRHIAADYLDAHALEQLAGQCAAVTTEFENVPAQALRFLGEHGIVSPSADSVAIAQDRIAEKQFIASCGVAVAPHAVVGAASDLEGIDARLYPGILKVSRLGYDGKGQVRVSSPGEAKRAFAELGGVPCVLEARLDLAIEVSVVVVRAFDGATVAYPVAENIHRDGILAVSTIPAPHLDPRLAARATEAAVRIAERLEYRGVLCVEFFVLHDGALIANEMAPRPHNSGHYTIDACVTSQFEQQARVLARLPLGSVRQHSAAVMLNLLGELWLEAGVGERGASREPDWAGVLKVEGACLHLYGKSEARRGRKMGHVTVVGTTSGEAEIRAREIAQRLGIASW
jgi:5-(carboxyamino)imidazole ribonucleotide synthase